MRNHKPSWESRLDTVEFGFDLDGEKLKKFISKLLKSAKEDGRREVAQGIEERLRAYVGKYPKATFDEALWCIKGYKGVQLSNLKQSK